MRSRFFTPNLAVLILTCAIMVSLTSHAYSSTRLADGLRQSLASDKSPQDQIRNMMTRWLNAYNTRDIDALMAIYSERIYYANASSPLKDDVASIRAGYEDRFRSPVSSRIDFDEERLGVSGGVGYIAGKYRVTAEMPEGATSEFFGRVFLLFELENSENGSAEWKLVVDFDNVPPDASRGNFN